MKLLVFTLVGFVLAHVDCANTVPDVVQACRRSDPRFDKCILDTFEALRPFLIKGNPEKDIPQLDPFVVEEVKIADKAKTGFGLSVSNLVGTGAGQFQLSDFKPNTKDNVYELTVTIPTMKLKGEYNVDGEILRLPIKGHGPFTGEFNGITGIVKAKADLELKNGYRQMIIKKLRIRLRVNSGKIKIDNLFNGDENIGKAVNDIINDNFASFSNEMIPIVEKILEDRIKDAAGAFVAQFDYDKYLPE